MIFGWIGLGLLVLAYILLITKWSKLFIVTDLFACLFLVFHALTINDIPFFLVNVFIVVVLLIKQIKGGIE